MFWYAKFLCSYYTRDRGIEKIWNLIKIKNCLTKTLAQSGKQKNQINAHTTTFYVYFVNIQQVLVYIVSAKPCLLQVIHSTPCKMSIEPCIKIVLACMIFSRILKGMQRQNIEHFLKKRKYEKFGFSKMN